MLTARARVSAVLLAAALPACEGKPEQQPQQPPPPITSWEVETDVAFPLADPAKAEPLEVFYAKEIVGDGYPRQPVSFGPTLYSGKWLGFAGGHDEFLGDHHIIINHYAGKPRDRYVDPISHSVLLDVDSGEVVARFLRHRDANWHRGLAVVEVEDDPRPHLLDAKTGTLVPAMPDGDHGYVYQCSYWIELSHVDDRVWIFAEDEKQQVHLFEWEDRSKPPPLPNNPFPFFPEWWAPNYSGLDADEVSGNKAPEECKRAILRPPRGYRCLSEYTADYMGDSTPLSGGWRYSFFEHVAFNLDTGRGVGFDSLCEGVNLRNLSQAPPRLLVECSDDDAKSWVWSPEALYRIPSDISTILGTAKGRLHYNQAHDSYWLSMYEDSTSLIDEAPNAHMARLIGNDYDCEHHDYRARWQGDVRVMICEDSRGRPRWADLINDATQTRSRRLRNVDMFAVSPNEHVATIRTRSGRQVVALVQINHPS